MNSAARIVTLAAVVSVAVLGCTSGQSGTGATSRCIDVPQPAIDALSQGLTVTGGGSVRHVKAVKSTAFSNAYFVSADLEGSGLEGSDDIGTWVTTDLTGGAGFFSVDAVAKEFSDWGDGSKTDAKFSMSDDGAQLSADCARG